MHFLCFVQLRKAMELAEENSHSNLAKCLKRMAEVFDIVSKGKEDQVSPVNTPEGREATKGLEQAENPKGMLTGIHRLEHR